MTAMSSPEPTQVPTFSQRSYPATLRQIVTAQQEGAQAVNDNLPPVSCPYRDTDEETIFLAAMWHRGYQHRQDIIRAFNSDDANAK